MQRVLPGRVLPRKRVMRSMSDRVLMNIYVCGPVGYETARKLYTQNKEMLERRFPHFFLEQFESIEGDVLQLRTEPEDGVYVREITEGGLLRALWEVGKELSSGLHIELEKIPVRQEITEIMEVCKESPYECPSAGSYVIAAGGPEAIIDIFKRSGYVQDIPFARIGRTADTAARVVCFRDMVRYLTPPSRQDKDINDRKNAGL